MPKAKLAKRVEWIKRLKSYKNKDKRCHYPWTISNVGYCWGWANYIDGTTGKPDCLKCEYWKEIK